MKYSNISSSWKQDLAMESVRQSREQMLLLKPLSDNSKLQNEVNLNKLLFAQKECVMGLFPELFQNTKDQDRNFVQPSNL